MAKKYTVWAYWDNSIDFNDIQISPKEPLTSDFGFYHSNPSTMISICRIEDKLNFINKVCWLEPGECKSFEVEVDET